MEVSGQLHDPAVLSQSPILILWDVGWALGLVLEPVAKRKNPVIPPAGN